VMSRIMPAFCSSVRPAAMLTVISGILVSLCSCYVTTATVQRRRHHPQKRVIQYSAPLVFDFSVTAY
jgi:hypothetical protein